MQTLLNGLTAQKVDEERRAGHVSVVPDKSPKSAARIVFENVFTYFNGIFSLLAVLLVVPSQNQDRQLSRQRRCLPSPRISDKVRSGLPYVTTT